MIGTHTGNITHIVADIVCDGCQVERMIFRDAGFNFTDEIGTHVGCLCIDASTYAGKECNRRGAEGEAGDDGHD